MTSTFEKRLALVWLTLSAITLASVAAAYMAGHTALHANPAVTAGVLLVSLFKVRLILTEFMEARQAPAMLRRLADAWLVVTALALLVPYLVATDIGA